MSVRLLWVELAGLFAEECDRSSHLPISGIRPSSRHTDLRLGPDLALLLCPGGMDSLPFGGSRSRNSP